jgi:hypothetical protein
MQFERKMDYLNKKKIIYRRDPINDKPSEIYEWGYYYENGTYECYTLFNSKAKINTYKSLKWHLYVLWYLNDSLTQDQFENLAKFLCDKSNGFVTFTVSDNSLENIIYEVSMCDLEKPPPNKSRKILFKDNSKLEVHEKLSIVGSLIGKQRLSETEIYDAMLLIHDNNEKITISKIADYLKCSTRTVHRNMGTELKKEKQLLNMQL